MVEFLNTYGLNDWIPKIIQESEKNLVILTPYISISESIYSLLKSANDRGVEITVIYRENQLTGIQKEKLFDLDNLNLFYHENLHAKCFLNENTLVIGSMNLYEYSSRNNREMGVVFSLNNRAFDNNVRIFEDIKMEINHIISSPEWEKKSRETIEDRFLIELLQTNQDKVIVLAEKLTKHFGHKRFEAVNIDNNWYPVCRNYADKIDLIWGGRIEFQLNYDNDRIDEIFQRFKQYYTEYMVDGFKVYWNHPTGTILLYPNSKHSKWMNIDSSSEIELKQVGIDDLIRYIKTCINPKKPYRAS